MNGIYALTWLSALLIWGDYKHWQKYYSTILFFVFGDLLYLHLLHDHYPMWRLVPRGVDYDIGIRPMHITFSIWLIKYPATVMIYLYKFPNGSFLRKFSYIGMWVGIYAVNELIDLRLNLIKYYNGWNFLWSIVFNLCMFTILRIHYKKSLWAWACSILFMTILWVIFDVPYKVFR